MGALITILALVFVTGLCIGSFLNVVILRTLSEESIVFPASKCPKCQTPLKWWHNIPVISYICLKGKCAFCKEPISIQYPIIELITGIVYTLLFMKFGVSFDTLFAWIFSALLIVIAGTDIKEKVADMISTYHIRPEDKKRDSEAFQELVSLGRISHEGPIVDEKHSGI